MVLICLNVDSPPIRVKFAQAILALLVVLNAFCFVVNFVVLIVQKLLNSSMPYITATTSIVNGVIFALSSALLYTYIRKFSTIDPEMISTVRTTTM